MKKYTNHLLLLAGIGIMPCFTIFGCNGGGGETSSGSSGTSSDSGSSSGAPQGSVVPTKIIRFDSPPAGYTAIVIWAQTATLAGGQSSAEKAFVTVDYWKMIKETPTGVKTTIFENHYDYNTPKSFTVDEAGLYLRYPTWFPNDSHTQATNMVAQNSFLTVDVSKTPDNIVHWWASR